MIYKFRTLLLRNYQAFLFISNNQTLLDTHDYQANICTRFPLESWVKKIQCKGTTQFLFRDKWSFVHNPFLMVTTTNLLYSSLWQLSFWRKQTFHFSNVLSVQPFSSYTFYLQNSKIWLVSGTEFFSEHIGWLPFVRDHKIVLHFFLKKMPALIFIANFCCQTYCYQVGILFWFL